MLLTISGAASIQSPSNELDWERRKANQFYDHFNAYYRSLFACPAGKDYYNPKTDCHPHQGTLDYKEFKLARDSAKALFKLRD